MSEVALTGTTSCLVRSYRWVETGEGAPCGLKTKLPAPEDTGQDLIGELSLAWRIQERMGLLLTNPSTQFLQPQPSRTFQSHVFTLWGFQTSGLQS